jgi:hypothetical protein
MARIINTRHSAALVLSAIALFISLGGVSYGLASGTIGSREIKNNAVRSKDIRNSQVQGKDVRNGSLTGADAKDDSVTGADVLESSLGVVPSSQSAQTAINASSVDSMSLAKIDFAAPSGTPITDVVSLGGVTIQASCVAGNVTAYARSGVNNAMIHVSNVDAELTVDSGGNTPGANDARYLEDDDFDNGTLALLALSTTNDSLQGSFSFASPDGSIVTATYLVEERPNGLGSANDCFIKGTAVHG